MHLDDRALSVAKRTSLDEIPGSPDEVEEGSQVQQAEKTSDLQLRARGVEWEELRSRAPARTHRRRGARRSRTPLHESRHQRAIQTIQRGLNSSQSVWRKLTRALDRSRLAPCPGRTTWLCKRRWRGAQLFDVKHVRYRERGSRTSRYTKRDMMDRKERTPTDETMCRATASDAAENPVDRS